MIPLTTLPRLQTTRRARLRAGKRSPYALFCDELLEFPGYSGMRGLCHLLTYGHALAPYVCITGNFDSAPGPSTTNVIEHVATAIATRLDTDGFRLINWHPRRGTDRFMDIKLKAVPPTATAHGLTLVTQSEGRYTVTDREELVTRFIEPTFHPLDESDIGKLIGESQLRQLYAFAGIEGDYTPQRLFGTHGQKRVDAISQHNHARTNDLFAGTAENPRRGDGQ